MFHILIRQSAQKYTTKGPKPMAPGICIETYLQQQDAGPLTGGGRLVVPDRRLHLTDMCLAEQQHGQARLANAAADRRR